MILREIQVQTQIIKKNCTINEPKMGNFHDSFTNLYKRFIAELQIKPKSKSNQTKNLERLYNCLVVVVVTLRTVLMLLWPLKMLTNN